MKEKRMKSVRAPQLSLALIALLLAALACSLPIGKTQVKPTAPPTSEAKQSTQAPEPTLAPEPTATTSESPEGETVLEESFSDNSNKWYVGKDKDSEAAIEDGKYKVRVILQDNYYWFEAPVEASDVDMTVDTEFTEGAPENAGYGFLCHYKDADNHYRFSIAPDGYYSIYKWVGGKYSVLIGWEFTNAIQKGTGVVNTIRAICTDNHLTMYVNDSLVADVTDTSLSGGSYALMAANFKNSKTDTKPIGVSFSNLVVRKATGWKAPTDTLLSDSFDDNNNGWDVYKHDKASAQIENGQMVISVTEPDSTYVVNPGMSLSNVDMSYDVVVSKGTPVNTSYGAACRWIDKDNRYMFDLSADGQYSLNKRVAGESTQIVKWTASDAFKTSVGDVNHLRVVCNGDTLELYVNDQQLISTQDTSLAAGGFALQAGRFKEDTKPVSVGFDNLEVSYPEK
jgi:hypothetical protein